jgi:hypothetical protein
MKTEQWTAKATTPTEKGWYITRAEDGSIDWRSWGCGAWWKQTNGGWFRWFDGEGEPIDFDWMPETRRDVTLDRHELPDAAEVLSDLANKN